eukprot:15011758-Ditylum_brightwellii.AAC.1
MSSRSRREPIKEDELVVRNLTLIFENLDISNSSDSSEESKVALAQDQIAAITAAAINAAGLGANAETFSDNPFADNINLWTKNGLALFNAATPSVPLGKQINLTTKTLKSDGFI